MIISISVSKAHRGKRSCRSSHGHVVVFLFTVTESRPLFFSSSLCHIKPHISSSPLCELALHFFLHPHSYTVNNNLSCFSCHCLIAIVQWTLWTSPCFVQPAVDPVFFSQMRSELCTEAEKECLNYFSGSGLSEGTLPSFCLGEPAVRQLNCTAQDVSLGLRCPPLTRVPHRGCARELQNGKCDLWA